MITSTVLEERPPPPPVPDFLKNILSDQVAFAKQFRVMSRLEATPMTRPDPNKLAAYRKELALLTPLAFYVKNTGKILVADARVVVMVPKHENLRVLDEQPERPRGRFDPPRLASLASHLGPRTRTTNVDDCGGHWEIEARLGKIQPNAEVWSLPFWLGSPVPMDLRLVARVFGDNIATPIDVPLKIVIEVGQGWLDDDEAEAGDRDASDH